MSLEEIYRKFKEDDQASFCINNKYGTVKKRVCYIALLSSTNVYIGKTIHQSTFKKCYCEEESKSKKQNFGKFSILRYVEVFQRENRVPA